MQGAVPYIMAIAITNESPIVIVALNDGIRRKKGTVNTARMVNIIQPLLYGLVNRHNTAHTSIGNANKAIDAIYAFNLNVSFAHIITRYR